MSRVIDELTYFNYVFNRQRSPGIAPERWAKVYEGAAQLEERFNRENRPH